MSGQLTKTEALVDDIMENITDGENLGTIRDALEAHLAPEVESIRVFQVLNLDGNPAGNDQHELALFITMRKAEAWVEYLEQECGAELASHTIKPMDLKGGE